MICKTLPVPDSHSEAVDVFSGYDHNLRIANGAFYDMRNMTSDYYPVLSPRGPRGVYATPAAPAGLIAKDALCYVDGADLYINHYKVDAGLSVEYDEDGNLKQKQLVSMGSYIIILPDKKYINTVLKTGEDYQCLPIEQINTVDGAAFSLCDINGNKYTDTIIGPDAPENTTKTWLDTSSDPHSLKKYTASNDMWVSIATTYIKIEASGIGKGLNQYDGVTISGVEDAALQSLNASAVLWACEEDYIVVVGLLDHVTEQDKPLTVARTMPLMDFVTESGNRLWGCRYGIAANGEVVNEIYASKLGDFKNWNCFMGISTDSYVASCGSDGQFTGAITHLGYPLFFKENCIHKVYGQFPSNFQIQETECRGVERGCERSLAVVNETLFYKAKTGVCAFGGSLPQEISYAFGDVRYSNAVAGGHGNKYYISMADHSGQYHLFVYDTGKNMWHKEDNTRAACFCSCRNELYFIDYNSKQIMAELGAGDELVSWMVETGDIGLDRPEAKYLSRLKIRMALDAGATVHIYAQYDYSRDWELLYEWRTPFYRSVSIPVRPRRCDHLRLKIEGTGNAKIYSILKVIEEGSVYE